MSSPSASPAVVEPVDQEQRFRRLVDTLDHAVVWEFDEQEQRYTFVSEHSRLVLGYPCEEWMHDPQFLLRRIDEQDRPKFEELLLKLRAGEGNDMRCEHRCIKHDGSVIWLHTGVHRADERGQSVLRGVSIDISNVKRAEERERAAKEAAERTTHAYEEVMAIVSHDLRSPLLAIRLAAASLAADASLAERIAPLVKNAAVQMEHLIDDLTDLSQIRTRTLKVSPTEASSDDILREAIDRFGPIAEERHVRVVATTEGGAVLLRCDAKRIAQVLGNLVSNAIRFSKDDGTAVVEIGVRVDELEATFTVSDNGPGIAPADLQRVFDREWQADRTSGSGTGLGLYIAKGIVSAHAGRLWVESILGRGASFHFTLPRT